MRQLTQEGQRAVADIAGRYQLSAEAIQHMLNAVNNGAGSMAQFNCPELGGSGQWMRGGMTMVGDMFNHGLKSTVDNLCNELSTLLANTQVYPVASATSGNSNQWWPDGLGAPHSSGSQNGSRYAVFSNRLAVESAGQVTVYDTLDHQINGVSQQQGNDATLTFRSQHGMVSLESLPRVSDAQDSKVSQPSATDSARLSGAQDSKVSQTNAIDSARLSGATNTFPNGKSDDPPAADNSGTQESAGYSGGDTHDASVGESRNKPTESASDVLSLIEKLAELHSAGILSDEEFNSKKQDLLSRI